MRRRFKKKIIEVKMSQENYEPTDPSLLFSVFFSYI